MANNYLQFSEMLFVETDEQKAWVDEFLRQPSDELLGAADGSKEFVMLEQWTNEHGCDVSDGEFYPSFNAVWEKSKKGYPHGLWLSAEESVNLDEVAALVQSFFKRFNIDGTWTLTYAAWCSQMRIGEFSGGGFIVLPFGKSVEWCDLHEMFAGVKRRLRG